MKNLLLLLSITLLVGCSKPLPCELNNTGSLKAVSTEIDSYYVYLDQEFIGVAEPATITKFENINVGAYSVLLINTTDSNQQFTGAISITTCVSSSINF